MNSYKGNAIGWYSYNLPATIAGAGQSSQFWYGPNRNRWKQVASYPSGTETTLYLGGILEKVTVPSGTAYRHYVGIGSAKLVYTRWSSGSENTKYVTSDHLNSSTVVMDSAGNALVSMSFGAYGARRGAAWSGSPAAGDWTQINNATRHGFTGHEHLDNVNLIHMNGRVFEPVLGRFLSADQIVDGLGFSQGFNRYAYVHGNPLTMIDPNGHCGADPGMSEEEASEWVSRCSIEFEAAGYGILGANERWCASSDFHCQQQILKQKMAEHAYTQGIYRDMRGGGSRPLPKGKVEVPDGELCTRSVEECIAEFGDAGRNILTGQAGALLLTDGAAAASKATNQYGWANLSDDVLKKGAKTGKELLTHLNRFDAVVDGADLLATAAAGDPKNEFWYKAADIAIEGSMNVLFGPVVGTVAGGGVAFRRRVQGVHESLH